MEAYIKSFGGFHTLSQHSVVDYKLVLDSLDTQKSSVTVGEELPGSLARSWLIFNSLPYWIGTVSPKDGKTVFTAYAPETIFDRLLMYEPGEDTTIGGFISRIISEEWINQPDDAYSTPYIQVTNNDNTAFAQPEVDENTLFNFLSYIQAVRQAYNITLHFAVDGNKLKITISRDASTTHPLILNDGHTKLASSTFASSTVTKLTVIQPVAVEVPEEEEEPEEEDEEEPFEITKTDWYLSTDGFASTTIPANRADGEWETIVISEQDDQSEKVQEEFAKNGESHKIELYTDTAMEVNDRFRLRLGKSIYDGTVIRKTRKKGDNRILYTSGDLITTLQERVHQTAAAQQGGYTGDGTGQMYAVGDVFITTRTGNPAVLLGYGAWEQVQGRFLFAVDESHAVRSTGGSDEQTLEDANLPASLVKSSGLSTVYSPKIGGSATPYNNYVTGSIDKAIGTGQAFSIMPPYFAVYVWIRRE